GGGVIDVVAKFGAKADEKTNLSKTSVLSKSLNGFPSIELKISNCLPDEFYTAREPLLIKGKNLWFDFLTNAMIQYITTKDSKQFHVNVLGCKNITFKHFTIFAPGESPNTNRIHIGRLDRVNVLNTKIKTGDDCVSIRDDSKYLVINGVTCGLGHGISIGSHGLFKNEEPINGVTVKNCTMTNTSNGVRIKSWSGAELDTCSNIHFEDITVTNEESKVKLSNISFKNIHDTSALPEAVKIIYSTTLSCENVELADIEITHSGLIGPAVSHYSNVKPKVSGKQNPVACSAPI
ncbi:hypothetical protein Goklo_025908, partial [Gossypium klotzschianum]|nr:hypothetical protein [Gossypium klotzschianum]